jgi:hypothetical protein
MHFWSLWNLVRLFNTFEQLCPFSPAAWDPGSFKEAVRAVETNGVNKIAR